MKRKITQKAVYSMILCSALVVSSCVDNAYDLSKDIDMTITVGGDLTTPGSSTENITLDDLFDIDYATSDIQLRPDSSFYFSVTGDKTHSNVSVERVTIDPSHAEKESDPMGFRKNDVQNKETPALAIQGLTPEWSLTNDHVSHDVVDIYQASHLENGKISLSLEIVDPDRTTRGVILKQGLKFVFPSYVEVSLQDESTFELKKFADGHQEMILKKDYKLSKGARPSWEVFLNKVYFKEDKGVPAGQGFDAAAHRIHFDVKIPVEGQVAMSAGDFEPGVQAARFTLKSYVVSQEMDLKGVRAIVNPDIDFQVSDVEINDLPDFLKEDGVVLDLHNPQVRLNVNNKSDVAVNFKALLQAYSEDGQPMAQTTIGNELSALSNDTIRLYPGENKLCISPYNEDVPEGYIWVSAPGVAELIKKVPKRISVEHTEAKVLPRFFDMSLGVDYDVQTDYLFESDLKFGQDFNIIYNDTLDGWTEDLDDYEFKQVEVVFNAQNQVPLNFKVEASAIDAQGHVMNEVEVKVEGDIKADSKENALHITMRRSDGQKIKNLDGMILKLTGSALQGGEEGSDWTFKQLKANQTLKLEDLKLKLKGGVTMDLN